MNNILISIVGPTGIGKTKLAILLAQHFGTEILSADSRQFFKEMTIGTAVPSHEELAAVPHHFIQHLSISEKYAVGNFERDAIKKLEKLFQTKEYVIMVGGSGLYSDAVIFGLNKFPGVDSHIRTDLNEEFRDNGIDSLQRKLALLDPEYFKIVDINNPHRLIRALEICVGTGKPYSSFLNKEKPKRNFKILSIGLHGDRNLIYERINNRVDAMIAEGLVDEAKKLHPFKKLNALQTVGYKELFAYFEGAVDLGFAIAEIKRNTRRFAKRQITWFKKNKNTLWLNFNYKKQDAIKQIEEKLSGLKNE